MIDVTVLQHAAESLGTGDAMTFDVGMVDRRGFEVEVQFRV